MSKIELGASQEKLLKFIPPYDEPEIIPGATVPREQVFLSPRISFALLPDKKIAWGVSSRYEIFILDDMTQLIMRIEKKHSPELVSENYILKYLNSLPAGFSKEKYRKRIAKDFPAFDFFFTDEKGRIYVKTYHRLENQDKYIFDIFESDGRFLTQTALKVDDDISTRLGKFVVKNNMLFTTGHDDEGFPTLVRYKVKWSY